MRGAIFTLLFGLFIMLSQSVMAEVNVAAYDLHEIDAAFIKSAAARSYDSLLHQNILLQNPYQFKGDGMPMQWVNKNFEFYYLLFLFLFLGIIRMLDVRVFERMQTALINPTQKNNLRIENGAFYSLNHTLLNVFANLSLGTFIWAIALRFGLLQKAPFGTKTALLLFIGTVLFIYVGKILFLKISGWAFSLKTVFNQYGNQVLFINKLMGIVLLPLTALLLFVPYTWLAPVLIIAALAMVLLFLLRYVRSWNTIQRNVPLSRFHFFTYICAAEILPVIIIWKLVTNGINL